MKYKIEKDLTSIQSAELLILLKNRFENNMSRHKDLEWFKIQSRIEGNLAKMWTLSQMEETGGEPDVVEFDENTGEYIFYDCSSESPVGRRSFCYDTDALLSRKENKPKDSALGMALEMGIDVLTEEQYRKLQQVGKFDSKTSSWLLTPTNIRKLGGAIFGDFRFEQIFIYHNGAESYYAGRGFRGLLKV